jgi:hypothetical protein
MDYSLDSYRLIIERAQAAGYAFLSFALDERQEGKRIYLRHDVDYSLEMALELARVNAALGVSATFCVLLRSQIYNLLSSWSLELVEQIHGLGQHLGLHATTSKSEIDAMETELRADFNFAKRNLPMMSEVFCWHNPTPEALQLSTPFERMAGLVNAYGARFTRDIAYFSDSNMRNSVEGFLSHVESAEHPAMQLLFHPFNWVAGGGSMREILARTWPYVIRERDREVSLNYAYRRMLPEGIPEGVLRDFAKLWHEAAGKGQV